VAGYISEPDLSFTFDTHCGWDMLVPCLVLPDRVTDSTQIRFISRVLSLCAEIEASGDRYNNQKIDDKLLFEFPQRLAELVWNSPTKVKENFLDQLKAVCKQAPDLVHSFFTKHLHLADINKNIGA
jgi:hypothetical protein